MPSFKLRGNERSEDHRVPKDISGGTEESHVFWESRNRQTWNLSEEDESMSARRHRLGEQRPESLLGLGITAQK